jgi:hypothetical protein
MIGGSNYIEYAEHIVRRLGHSYTNWISAYKQNDDVLTGNTRYIWSFRMPEHIWAIYISEINNSVPEKVRLSCTILGLRAIIDICKTSVGEARIVKNYNS